MNVNVIKVEFPKICIVSSVRCIIIVGVRKLGEYIINPSTGKAVLKKDAIEQIRSVDILLINNVDKERQVANLCYNIIEVGKGTLFPAYFAQVAEAVYKTNVKNWTWEQVKSGKHNR